MDDALYRLHAEREETYWWWVGKNRIVMALVQRYWNGTLSASEGSSTGARGKTPLACAQGSVLRPRALDIGCGAGGVLAKLSGRFEAVGVDMSPIAREYCARRGLVAVDGMLPGGLPFCEPGSFDVIVMSEVIEHVREDRASVRRVAELLAPGGVLVCTVPAHRWLWSSHDDFNLHQRRYTRREFGALFDGLGLEQLVLSYYQVASLPLVVAGRVVEKVRTRVTGVAPAEPEVKPLPAVVNWVLTRAFEAERWWLPHFSLPWGTSVISVHRRAGE